MEYRYSCVAPSSRKELDFIIENSRDITRATFVKNVGTESYKELEIDLGYSKDFKLKNDQYVSYHKSKTPKGRTVYYCTHSSIEYIYY